MDGSNVEYYAKLIRRGCEKASKVRMQTTSNTLQNLCEKGPTIILKSIKVHPNFINIRENSSPETRPGKNMIFVRKSDPKTGPGFFRIFRFGSQNGIRKSWKNQHRKSIQKICPRGRKGMQNAPKMAPKISENPYKNQCRKRMEKTLKNETVESWKSLVFLRKNIHFAKSARSRVGWKSRRKSHPKWCKNPSQNHTKFNTKSTCRKISEKYGQITEKGRKWSPKATQKSTKSMQKLMPGKGLKKLKKSAWSHRPWDVLNGQETLLELLHPLTLWMVALIVLS